MFIVAFESLLIHYDLTMISLFPFSRYCNSRVVKFSPDGKKILLTITNEGHGTFNTCYLLICPFTGRSQVSQVRNCYYCQLDYDFVGSLKIELIFHLSVLFCDVLFFIWYFSFFYSVSICLIQALLSIKKDDCFARDKYLRLQGQIVLVAFPCFLLPLKQEIL